MYCVKAESCHVSQRVLSESCSKTRKLMGRNSSSYYCDLGWLLPLLLSAKSIEASATLCFVTNPLLSRCSEVFINACLAHEVVLHYCDVNACPELTVMQKFLKIKIQITFQGSTNKICMTNCCCAPCYWYGLFMDAQHQACYLFVNKQLFKYQNCCEM